MIVNSEAIIIDKKKYSNTSLIITFFTKKYGKLVGLVKGAFRKGKYNSSFNLYSLNQIVFYKKIKESLEIVSECNLIDSFPKIKEDIYKSSYAFYFIELINLATEKEQDSQRLFRLLKGSLQLLSEREDLERISRIFEVRLLFLSGLMPRIDSCASCGEEIEEKAWFREESGGLLCSKCVNGNVRAEKLFKGTTLSIRQLVDNEVQFLQRFQFTEKVGIQLKQILKKFLNYHFGKKTNSVRFLNQLKKIDSVKN